MTSPSGVGHYRSWWLLDVRVRNKRATLACRDLAGLCVRGESRARLRPDGEPYSTLDLELRDPFTAIAIQQPVGKHLRTRVALWMDYRICVQQALVRSEERDEI